MQEQAGHLYTFDAFRLDPQEYSLTWNGRPVPLSPKAFETLLVLVQNAGHLVEKDDLLRRLWPDSFVEEGNITKHISMLRKALDETANGAEYIETVPKRGYRFVSSVTEIPKGAADAEMLHPSAVEPVAVPQVVAATPANRWRAVAAVLGGLLLVAGFAYWRWKVSGKRASSAVRSIAVMPLENLSGDLNQEYFSDGMTEELITALAQVQKLKVISRTSSMQFRGARKPLREIAHVLGADVVLEGSVLRSADRVRITVQLLDGKTDRHLWAETYDRALKDVLEIQQDVAKVVSVAARPAPLGSGELRRVFEGPIFLESVDRGGCSKGCPVLQPRLGKGSGVASGVLGTRRRLRCPGQLGRASRA
jgi:TolB-like protein/DNA-binding winged helix-turn-helix (wHTH) protein